MFKSLRLTLALFIGALVLPLIVPGGASATSATAKPSCIVSLSPTATETLFAIGAGKQVQAVDTDSDFPTTGLPKKRINGLSPSVEAVDRDLQDLGRAPVSEAGPRRHLL